MSTLTPITDRILCEEVEAPKETKMGILLPDSAKNKEVIKRAKVIAVGKEVKNCKPGDTVFFGQYAYLDIEFEGKSLWITRDFEIDAVLG